MVVGVDGLVAAGLIIAEDMVVAVAQALASGEFYVDVAKYVVVAVS